MLADRVARRSEAVRAADPVSMDEFADILALGRGTSVRTKSGTSIGATRALGIAAWYSGVRYLSEVMAGLPCHRYRSTVDGRERIADPDWMARPDNELPWYGLIEFAMMSFLHKGNSFSFKVRGPSGQVVGLREIHPDRVTSGIAPDGSKRFLVDRNEYEYTTREILHIPGLSYDGRFGMDPIRYNADVLGAAAATDDYAARFFANGTNLGGVISVSEPMTKDQLGELKEQWEEFHQGILNAHRTGVLSNGATYNRITLDAASTQLLESRQYGVLEVARLLRLPPHKLYELSRATFSNIEQQSIEAITDGIQPWVERIEAFVNYDLDLTPPGTFIEFQLEGRLRGDTKSRFDAYSSAVGGPWLTVNESRRLENRPPIEGGDVLLSPMNMAPSGDIDGSDFPGGTA